MNASIVPHYLEGLPPGSDVLPAIDEPTNIYPSSANAVLGGHRDALAITNAARPIWKAS